MLSKTDNSMRTSLSNGISETAGVSDIQVALLRTHTAAYVATTAHLICLSAFVRLSPETAC